jgi:hypothetical protein
VNKTTTPDDKIIERLDALLDPGNWGPGTRDEQFLATLAEIRDYCDRDNEGKVGLLEEGTEITFKKPTLQTLLYVMTLTPDEIRDSFRDVTFML